MRFQLKLRYKAEIRNETDRLKSVFCWNEKISNSMKDPAKLEVTNRRRKSIQTHKRNIQC